jgi:PhzF family phenazine biosynthesis protein
MSHVNQGSCHITNACQGRKCIRHFNHRLFVLPPLCNMATTSQLDFVTVDVFTSKPYQGNPLAIVRIPSGCTLTQEQKQAIAREFNLSETTFLHENAGGVADLVWTVDIFMTSRELPFAGHPTVGTACYVLGRTAKTRGLESGVIEASFNLKAGRVGLRYDVAKMTAKASIPHDVYVDPSV